MKLVRVPLAVDAQVRYALGPLQLPVRAIVLLALAFPLALNSMNLGFAHGAARLVAPVLIVSIAIAIAAPMVEGIWIGTYALYRGIAWLLPSAVENGRPLRAHVGLVGEGIHVERRDVPERFGRIAGALPLLPRAVEVHDGVFRLSRGGWRAVVELDAPAVAISTDEYGRWTDAVVSWLTSVGVPAQVVAVAEHHDRASVEQRFDDGYHGREIPLRDLERGLVGDVAEWTLWLRHYVVFAPHAADRDGYPYSCKPLQAQAAGDCSREETERVLENALRLVTNHGLRVSPAPSEAVLGLLRDSPLLCQDAAHSSDVVLINDHYQAVISVKALPPVLHAGSLVATLLRTRMCGVASLYLAPVEPQVARKKINVMRQTYQHVASKSGDVESQVMLGEVESLAAQLAARQVSAVVVALTLAVRGRTAKECRDLADRVAGSLEGDGLRTVRCTLPGFLPALAVAPGCMPLRRSLILTTGEVASCLVPALGTPFGRSDEPLLGVNVQSGTPAYLSVFRGRKNMNLLCVGTSGAGKSVTLKTLVYRHAVQGARVVVIDPDSEYGMIMRALGGTYVELGRHAINALAVDPSFSADDAAGCVVPSLSVMAGNEVGMSLDGHPIRRLPEEDKGWLHGEVAAFFSDWRNAGRGEPVIGDLLNYMERHSMRRAQTERERERCRVIIFRLRTFTQGARSRIFNQPTTFHPGEGSFAIGLRELALQYRADLTPALAIILGYVLGDLLQRKARMIVLVDEAHHITSDPDAGQVLARLVRQARKYGAGVWMASQQLEDFLSQDGLGRTLAATAATKVVLGLEASMADDAQAAFKLSPGETSWLVDDCPPGRAVVISGDERGVIDVKPGAHLLALAHTTVEQAA